MTMTIAPIIQIFGRLTPHLEINRANTPGPMNSLTKPIMHSASIATNDTARMELMHHKRNLT